MQRLLELGSEDSRSAEASKFLELLLCLLRNLLVVPDSGSDAHNGPRSRMSSHSAVTVGDGYCLTVCVLDMQEEFIRQLKAERILDLILVRVFWVNFAVTKVDFRFCVETCSRIRTSPSHRCYSIFSARCSTAHSHSTSSAPGQLPLRYAFEA